MTEYAAPQIKQKVAELTSSKLWKTVKLYSIQVIVASRKRPPKNRREAFWYFHLPLLHPLPVMAPAWKTAAAMFPVWALALALEGTEQDELAEHCVCLSNLSGGYLKD